HTICVPGIAILGEWRGALLIGSSSHRPPDLPEIALAHDAARRLSLSLTNAELYERAQQAIATRDRFLSVAAHELRTPITSVAGYADMLGKEVHGRKDPARIDRYVGRLQDAGTRLRSLAEDLLDVSRLRTNELTLRRGQIDLAVELIRIISGFRDRGEAPDGRVWLTSSGTSRPIDGDAERMEQVFSNLIGNALKYSPPESPVQLHLIFEPEHVRLLVADQGIGIDPVALQTIFDPFDRAANALGSEVPGLGLGLYIARSIVTGHGGTITASSDGPGTGTTVTVTLPYAQ
ncbi:MAG TPA: HAMP domain-containing sensor histidine kinase, partial [Thermomicrobiales bacterium]|nr:HAMP domain-containing sensor histidine kinase [Thermomicrobiales bacterium]